MTHTQVTREERKYRHDKRDEIRHDTEKRRKICDTHKSQQYQPEVETSEKR